MRSLQGANDSYPLTRGRGGLTSASTSGYHLAAPSAQMLDMPAAHTIDFSNGF
ncbi:MAG TPA: hypothetical protein VGC66_22305 [Pyrinomonadaceae bacterium]